MLYMVSGGSGSGKSEYAEKIAVLAHRSEYQSGNLYYIATMYPYDEECHVRIQKHRHMRSNKGFQTVECYTGLENVMAGDGDVVLLECMSNLLANEMYREDGRIGAKERAGDLQLEGAILEPVRKLAKKAGVFIIVTNEVFSDGAFYEKETEEYVRFLGKINTELAKLADSVIEVVYSIPIYHKGQKIAQLDR